MTSRAETVFARFRALPRRDLCLRALPRRDHFLNVETATTQAKRQREARARSSVANAAKKEQPAAAKKMQKMLVRMKVVGGVEKLMKAHQVEHDKVRQCITAQKQVELCRLFTMASGGKPRISMREFCDFFVDALDKPDLGTYLFVSVPCCDRGHDTTHRAS